MDSTITSDNIFRSSSIDAIIFNCEPLIMDVSLVLEDFFYRSKISPIIKGLKSRSLWSSFGWSTKRNFSEGLTLSFRPFQKVQREVSYFPYVEKVKSRHKLSKNCSINGKNCEISGPYNFRALRCIYY